MYKAKTTAKEKHDNSAPKTGCGRDAKGTIFSSRGKRGGGIIIASSTPSTTITTKKKLERLELEKACLFTAEKKSCTSCPAVFIKSSGWRRDIKQKQPANPPCIFQPNNYFANQISKILIHRM
jgi:hypothetical protein